MSHVLQQIAQHFDDIDPDKARELRRIDDVYTHLGLDGASIATDVCDNPTQRLLRYLPRMARMKGFRLYRIGVGQQPNGRYAHEAVALLDARQLPTPGNTLAVLDPSETGISDDASSWVDGSHQYSFASWQNLQGQFGHGCALLPDAPENS
jgi:hypothetical protein